MINKIITSIFYYTAKDIDGKTIKDQEEHENITSLITSLHRKNLLYIKSRRHYCLRIAAYSHPPKKQIHHFIKQLSMLISNHMPLSQSLEMILSNTKKPMMKTMISKLITILSSGSPLSEALSKFPFYFSNICIQMIFAGEQSGQLNKALQQFMQYETQSLDQKKKIKKALYYPCIVLFMSISITIGLLLFIVPQFEAFFSSSKNPLPAITQLIISCSHTLIHDKIILLICLCFALLASIYLSKKSTRLLDTIKTSFPFLNTITRLSTASIFYSLLSLLLSAKLPLSTSLQMIKKTLTPHLYQKELQAMINAITQGDYLHHAINEISFISDHEKQLIASSQSSSHLHQLLFSLSQSNQSDLNEKLFFFTTLLEPITMVLLSVIIGTFIIALYLPIFEMGNNIS